MKLIIANVYFPNDHREGIEFAETLYTNILSVQANYNEYSVICGGDFNVCLTPLDHLNRQKNNHEKELANVLINNNKTLDLVDSYRALHSTGGYTWKRGLIYSRLDHIFVSRGLCDSITLAQIDWSFESSDHAAVKIEFKIADLPTKGPGIPKINVKILESHHTAEKIREEIEEMFGNLDDSLNPHIKLEFFKVVIRSVFASNTGEIRKEIRN
jgi:hypothetical protein